jgi:pseudaminic acid synthase
MIKISDRKIDNFYDPYIIAEISANHNGSIETAKQTMIAAKNSGANAIKLQTYTADTMTINCEKPDFKISGGLWDGYNLYDLYKEAHTPFEWHQELFQFAKELDIIIFSTPFDETAVDLLESLDTPAYKIASFELTDLPLLKYIARTGKPILMSTGMASEQEIDESVELLLSEGCKELLLFHCISSYPSPIEQANLMKIKTLREKYQIPVGLSDHTIGNIAATVAVALGACAIEKHFILNREQKSPDSQFSIEPAELALLIEDTHKAWQSLGDGGYQRSQVEYKNSIFRRSLYFVDNLNAGQIIEEKHIRRIRPGYGLNPKFYEQIIGKVVNKDVTIGDSVKWNLILGHDEDNSHI